MRATMHNARYGSPEHNGRTFDLNNNDGHIDLDRMYENIYISFDKELPVINNTCDFKSAEIKYYKEKYTDAINRQNHKYRERRQNSRCRTITQLYQGRQTKPEETILQIGGINDFVDKDKFVACVMDFLEEMKKYDTNIHVLDCAIHLDEAVPHAHIRKVYDYENEYGERVVGQRKALEDLGIPLPDPNQKEGQYNNRKISLDTTLREKWYDICEEHGIEVDRQPIKGKQISRKKEDMIKDKEDHELLIGMELTTTESFANEAIKTIQEDRYREMQEKMQQMEQELTERKRQLAHAQEMILRLESINKEQQKQIEEEEEKKKKKKKRVTTISS